MTGTAHIIRGDARHLPLPDDTVDLVVTSPPYFALRSYQDGGEHYDGQIGDEATPAEFVDALLEVTRECVRVLKPSGSLWVNLGDKYAAGPMRPQGATGQRANRSQAATYADNGLRDTIAAKSLYGIPWRYAIRCIDELGLILRAEVIWSKPNGLPESVTDRVRRSHETWFHFTLAPRYYSAVDEIREEHARIWGDGPNGGRQGAPQSLRGNMPTSQPNPLGKLPGSVWTIPTEPLIVPPELGVDHFAAFPTEWPRRIIQGWSPAGVCVACGQGRRPVGSRERVVTQHAITPSHKSADNNRSTDPDFDRKATLVTITGYACACPEPTAPTTPGVVLDPFGGTGTTALVAKALGRHGISVDMSADYCRLAEWRTNDPKQLAKAARREFKASADPIEGQMGLFEFDGEAS